MQRPYPPRFYLKPSSMKERFFGDFEYVVNKPVAPILCFGTTLKRVTLPTKSKFMSPFMRRIAPEIDNDLGPATYENNRGAFYDLVTRKTGYGLGSRGSRFATGRHEIRPAPYSIPEPPLKKNCAPFNSTSKRKAMFRINNYPAPCDYYPNLKKKKLKCLCSFGGKQVFVCGVQVKCVPYNLDSCDVCNCNLSEQGDYWHYENRQFLCRQHYDELLTGAMARFKGVRLVKYKSIRDCFFAHAHHSCKAATKIMTSENIQKKLRTEAYLDLFMPQRRFD